MAAVLSHNMTDIKKVNFFLRECRRMKIKTLVPDVNESDVKFTVNKEGGIRFALSALKGMGENAVESLVEERNANGNYTGIFDLTKRVNLRTINKRNIESLAQSGAFDSLGEGNRAQYFIPNPHDNLNIVEKAVKFGSTYQQQQINMTASLFGDALDDQMVEPKIPDGEEWSFYEKLKKEKEITGIYISGHPLHDFELEMKLFGKGTIGTLEKHKGQRVRLAVIVSNVNKRMDKRGRPFASVTFDDLEDSIEVMLFSKDYTTFIPFLEVGNRLLITAMYQQRYNDELRYELKLQKIDFLADHLEEKAKGIQMRLPMSKVDIPFVNNLEKILKKHSGKQGCSFLIRNGTPDTTVNLHSKKCLVKIGKNLCDALDEMNINYEIIR